MKQVQSITALLCILLVSAPRTYAQQGTHWYSPVTHPYVPRVVPPVNVSNTQRIEALVRAGNIYLSLQDAIALALENNIDIEVERYVFPLAQADLLRAQAGASAQGISTATSAGSTGLAATGAQSLLGVGSAGTGGGGQTNGFDPTLNGTIQWGHITSPQQNTVTTGTTSLVTTNKLANLNITQFFSTGASATFSYNNSAFAQNSYLNLFNPVTSSYLDLTLSQPLLQGFGFAVNNRTIRVAKNNLQAADIVFKQQVINTVTAVVQAYWNLVFYKDDVEVKKKALAVSQKLYEDNKKQVEIGTLAPIEVIRAEAEVASDQQAVVTAETNVLTQETILKNALSRNGLANPVVAEAHIVPTDRIRIPAVEAVEPMQELIDKALDNRPELAQSRIQLENDKIVLQGTKNIMLPTMNAFVDLRNSGLAGSVNDTPIPGTNLIPTHPADPFFVGGYGSVLAQLFGRNFPNYTVGLQLSIPLRNRAAQANIATAQLNLRQNELSVQKLINQIRVDVQNALIALRQARAQYQAAVKTRILQEQTLDAEQKKYAVGASTPFLVIQAQRDLSNAGDTEVQAEANYTLARIQLDVSTGRTLEIYGIEIDDAKKGQVARPPSPLPVLEKNR